MIMGERFFFVFSFSLDEPLLSNAHDRSGSAANLEIALQIINNGIETYNRVLFAFWGAEELGLLGSTYYVNSLGESDRKQIALNLNFDMIVNNCMALLLFYSIDCCIYNRALPIMPDRSTMDQE